MGKEEKLPTDVILEQIEVVTTDTKGPFPIETKPKGRGITYTLKAFGENIKRLDEADLLGTEDIIALAEIRKNILQRYTGL